MPATLFQRTMPCNASLLPSSGFLTRSIRFPVLPSIGFRTGRLVFGTRSWRTNRLRYPSSALKRSPSTSMRYESHLPLLSWLVIELSLLQSLSRYPGMPALSISLSDELCIYHSDICKDNFRIDATTGSIRTTDPQHTDVLPKPFQEHGFFNIGSSFAATCGSQLGYQLSDIADTITRASAVLQQSGGDGSLGTHPVLSAL